MSPANGQRPNIIVFFTDQRWDTTGIHGNPLGLTPTSTGWRASTDILSITCQPVCGPARSCLQTGMYATNTGVFRNGLTLKDDAVTMAQCFNEAGYDTGYIGKWHLATQDPAQEDERGGYQYWLAANLLEFTSDVYDTVVFDNDNQPVKLPGYRVDALTDAAIRYIDAHQDAPFFLFVSYLEPHHQNHVDDYPPPDDIESRTLVNGSRRTSRRWADRRRSNWAATSAWSSGWTRRWAGCVALQKPGHGGQHGHSLHVGSWQPLQDAQRV